MQKSDQLKDILIKKLNEHFGERAQGYVVKLSTDIPFLQLEIDVILYNYFLVRVSIERQAVYLAVAESQVVLRLLKLALSDSNLDDFAAMLDKETRLRIPDKYLEAKGW